MNSIPLQDNLMQRSALIPILISLFFGIPFLLLTDFFPFHRYGMFARIPSKVPETEIRIMLISRDTTTELQTGSPCLDNGLLKKMAADAYKNPDMASGLIEKLRPSLQPFPDTIFLEPQTSSGWQRKTVYP